MPKAILHRKKRGFAVNVVDSWFSDAVGGHIEEMLTDTDSLMSDSLRPAAVKHLLDQHRAKQKDNHKVLFSLVLLEQWLRRDGNVQNCPSRLTEPSRGETPLEA